MSKIGFLLISTFVMGVVGRSMLSSTTPRLSTFQHSATQSSSMLRSVGGGNVTGVEGGGVVMQGEGVGIGDNEETIVRSSPCGSRFLPTTMSDNITQKCVNLIGFKLENFPPKDEDLIKINYEDKCFSKCYLTELNYMTPMDTFDHNRILDEISKETPREKTSARIRAIKDCLRKTEDMARDEGGVANSPCKFGLVFFSCARDAEKRMIC